MISWHPNESALGDGRYYARGFRSAQVSLARVANGITRFAWSGCVWQGGVRRQANFLRADLCVLDFDDGRSLAQAEKDFCDCQHIIGLTRSHGIKPGDRFRVVLPFTSPVTDLETYRATMADVIKRYDADPACKDGARFFWPCKEIVSLETEGYTQDIKQPEPKGPPPPLPRKGELTTFALTFLRTDIPEGRRNNYCYGFAKDCALAGIPAERVFQSILASRTYKRERLTAALREEIWTCVLNGTKAAREELIGGGYGDNRGETG